MQLGVYTIEREIGRGGAATVFLARDPRGARVAVKTLRLADLRDLASRERARGRFLREVASVLALLDVPGFVPVIDAGSAPDGTPWLAMPFLEGGTLRARLERGPFSVAETVALGAKLAVTLGHAHARGIVHRDLKPENVLFELGKNGAIDLAEPRVADLGLAKAFTVGHHGISLGLSKTGDAHGTVGYMAPECLDDSKHATPEADVFALGAILQECLTGRPAFAGATPLEVVAAVALGKLEPLARTRPETPPWLRVVIEQALATDPEDRYRDGSTLAAALGAREAARLPERRKGARARPPFRLLALGAVALGAMGTAALVVTGSRPDAPGPGASPAPRTSVRPTPSSGGPRPETGPAWFRTLAPGARPRLPLPTGVTPTDTAGVYRHEPDKGELVFVPEGPCLVGGFPDGAPLASSDVAGFFVGRTEVTNAQFARFVEAKHHVTEPEQRRKGDARLAEETKAYAQIRSGYDWRRPFPETPEEGPDPRCPVVLVSWNDAVAYCRWAGLRLLESDEWEKAAGWDPAKKQHRRFAWGDAVPGTGSPLLGNVAVERTLGFSGRPHWLDEPGRARDVFVGYEHDCDRLAPVGHFPLGASAYGADDMTGNAAEWVDCLRDGLQGYRGGGFWDGPHMCETTSRPGTYPSVAFDWLGFRVGLSER